MGGIYGGPDPVGDKVFQGGDALFGSIGAPQFRSEVRGTARSATSRLRMVPRSAGTSQARSRGITISPVSASSIDSSTRTSSQTGMPSAS